MSKVMGIPMHWTLIHLMLLGGCLVASSTTGGWSGCSATCQVGEEPVYKYQIHHCNDANKGDCNPPEPEKFPCNLPKCPIAGAWGEWTRWSACSHTCGSGVRRQTRRCNAPEPSAGGRYCEGHHEKLEHCNENPCPVRTSWTAWTVWTRCDKSECKRDAQSVRRRYCTPSAACAISNKTHEDERKGCTYDVDSCPVDGTWGNWGGWSECSVTCSKDAGMSSRRRSCEGQRNGGKPCEGEERQDRPCNGTSQCPEHCLWKPWSEWKEVGDKMLRNRERIGPLYGGKDCTGLPYQEKPIEVGSGSGSGEGDGDRGDDDNSGTGRAEDDAGEGEGRSARAARQDDDEDGNPSGSGNAGG